MTSPLSFLALGPTRKVLAALAVGALAQGCVVHVNDRPQRQPRPVEAQPQGVRTRPPGSQPVSTRPTQPTGQRPTQPTGQRPTQPTTGNANPSAPPAPTTELAPRIKSDIIFGNGRGGAFRGLAYVLPTGTKSLPDSFAKMVPFATLFRDNFDIKPQTFSGGFPGALLQEEWFAIRYEGPFEVSKPGLWGFRVTSDDGAALYVDGVKVVDNDGVHTTRTLSGQRQLTQGRHRLTLEYFQAARGQVALTVELIDPSGRAVILQGDR